jgi:chromosome segregation ATPase
MGSGNRPDVSSLTSSSKISNTLRDVLNQESLVRYSMSQQMQKLVMDALDNKRDSVTVKKKLSDITTELLSNKENDKVMKGENSLLKRELSTIKKAITSYEKLMLQKLEILNETRISTLAEKMEDENSKLRQELWTLNETNQRVDKEYAKLKQELVILNETTQSLENENSNLRQEFNNLKEMYLNNKQNIENIMDTSETISKNYGDIQLNLHMVNGSVQEHDSQLLNISSKLSSGKCKMLYYQKLQTYDIFCRSCCEYTHVNLKMCIENSLVPLLNSLIFVNY